MIETPYLPNIDQKILCPFCKKEGRRILMISDGAGRFICSRCGHVERQSESAFKCYCDNCQDSKNPFRAA